MGIEIIARHWDRPDWCGPFYPEDLPEDWRLAYFATLFESVLVPATAWPEAPPGRLAQWAGDVPPRFRFYLELGPDVDTAAAAWAEQALGDHFAGTVSIPSQTASPAESCLDSGPDRPCLIKARNSHGRPILARRVPILVLADPGAALPWLTALASEAGQDQALAIVYDAPPQTLTRWCQLVLLAGLA
jgi:hypothetical protein